VSAINTLLSGIKNVPDMSLPYMELAKIYMNKKDTTLAISYDEKGAEVPNPYPPLLLILQSYYHSKNDTPKENYYSNKLNALSKKITQAN
jgi:hypothetical protein